MPNIFPAILIFFLILLGLAASCFFGCIRLKNQVVRVLLGMFGILLALFLCFCLMFCYVTMVHVTTIDSSSSPDGKYSVVFQEKGQSFGFGPAACRLVLKKGKKIVAKESFLIANDGKVITEDRWTVTWKTDHVEVIINGEEQPDREYDLYFDGTTGHRYTKSWMARDGRNVKSAA